MYQTHATNEGRNKKFWIVLVFVLLGTTVFLGVLSTSVGNTFYRTQKELASLQDEKARLDESLIQVQSLTHATLVAQNGGFTRPTNLVYVTSDFKGLASR